MDTLGRVKIFLGCKSDAALARRMNMSRQNFLNQKKSGSVEIDAVKLAVSEGANEDWLHTGQGPMKATAIPAEPSWELRALIEEMRAAIKELRKDLDKDEKERSDLWDASNRHRAAIDRQQAAIDNITAALIQAEKQKDFLPLKILTGGTG